MLNLVEHEKRFLISGPGPNVDAGADFFPSSSVRFFEHVQNSPTSAKTIKIASYPYRFLLLFFYVVQVRTASDKFYIYIVGT